MAVIEIERSALPETTVYRAFTPKHPCGPLNQVEVGISLLVVGMDQDVGGAIGFVNIRQPNAIAPSRDA